MWIRVFNAVNFEGQRSRSQVVMLWKLPLPYFLQQVGLSLVQPKWVWNEINDLDLEDR